MTISLIGMMGSGKTTIGQALAKKMKLPFLDMDHQIEHQEGKKITEIFAKKGEKYFRGIELEYIKGIISRPNHILATGGGAFMFPEIRTLLEQYTTTIWLKCTPETIIIRTKHDTKRPLLNHPNREKTINDLVTKRYPIYQEAKICIENNYHDKIKHVVQKIILAIN